MRRITFLLSVLFVASVAKAQMGGPAIVDVEPVRAGSIAHSQAIVGTVEATVRATLAAEEGGLVAERLFDEGHFVKKGQPLVRVNTDLMRTQVNAVQGAIAALQAQIAQATAERERATLEVERMRPVIENRAAPQMQMDDAVRDLRVTEAVLANRNGMLAEKTAELDRLTQMIAKSELRAPFDGVVSRRHVEVGQWIKQGDAVADLVQLDPLYVRASVPERMIAMLQKGDEVAVTVDALASTVGGGSGDALVGKVDQILPESDPMSRTIAVKVLVPNPELKLRPGFLARATFLSSQKPEGKLWIVPKDAVRVGVGGAGSTIVAFRNGTSAIVPVRVAGMAGPLASVDGELNEGDMVVTRGNESLRGGEPLMPRNLGAPDSAPTTAPTTAATGAH